MRARRDVHRDKVLFKAFLPFADVIESVSDERGSRDGIWVYPTRSTDAATGICSPGQLHEDTVRELLPQLRMVAAEIRSGGGWAVGLSAAEVAEEKSIRKGEEEMQEGRR